MPMTAIGANGFAGRMRRRRFTGTPPSASAGRSLAVPPDKRAASASTVGYWDNSTTGKWTSASPDAAIADFTHTLMGLGADRDATPLQILTDHFHSAQTAGLSASDALKSTFVLACLSPSVVGIGQ